MFENLTKQVKTKEVNIGDGVTATEYQQGENPLLHKTVFTAEHWPSDISFVRVESGSVSYRFKSSFILPRELRGTFSKKDMAYQLVSSTLGKEAIKKSKFKFQEVVKPKESLVERLDRLEREQASDTTWEEQYREGVVYVHESRLKDGSNMATFTVHEPIALTLTTIKPKTEQWYYLEGEDLPFDLKDSAYSSVKEAAKGINKYIRIAMAGAM